MNTDVTRLAARLRAAAHCAAQATGYEAGTSTRVSRW